MERLSPDLIFQMDADGQHDPTLIPLFAYLANHGFSLIIGSRFAPGGSTPDFSTKRRVISIIGNKMLRCISGLPGIHDCTSGFRCIKTEVLKKCEFNYLSTRGYSFQSSVLWELLRHGAKVIEVPMEFRSRLHGETKLTSGDLLEFLVNVLKIRYRQSEEFIRFVLVGFSGLLINLGTYIFMTRKIGLDFALACPIAIELSIISNYLLNNIWTFRYRVVKIPFFRRLLRFHLVAALAGSLNYLIFLILVYIMSIHDIVANIIGVSFGVLVNYYFNSIWTWHQSTSILTSTISRSFTSNCYKGRS